MRLERVKTIILVLLVISSFALSFTLWTGVRQYEALPQWVLEASSHSPNNLTEEPVVNNIEGEKLLLSLLKPDKMIEHDKRSNKLYFLSNSTFSSTAWQKLNTALKTGTKASLQSISLSDWEKAAYPGSYEFIFAGSYPLDILFSNWETDNNIKIERLLVTTGEQPEVYARSLNYRQLYKIDFQDIEWPENGVKTFNGASDDKGWRVFDAGVGNDSIISGVYLPSNFVANYGGDFPEIYLTAETQETKKWVSVFFTNTSLTREIKFSNDRYNYSLSSTSLAIDYNKAPHIEYSYVDLSKQDIDKTNSESFLNSSLFIAGHNYTNWPKFDTDVRLTRTFSKSNKRTYLYDCYTTDLKYNVPLHSTIPAFKVENENGVVTEMSRQVWTFGRKLTLPKIRIEATEAIERLSLDKWKVATEENPYAEEVVGRFQQYLTDGYKISDVSMTYYTNQNLTEKFYIPPYWAVTLTNGNGTSVRFYINALTEHIPQQNGLIVE